MPTEVDSHNEALLRRMITERKVILSPWGYVEHYKYPTLVLVLSLIGFFFVIKSLIQPESSVRSPFELLFAALPFLLLAVLMFVIQTKRLRFKEFRKVVRPDVFELATEKIIDENSMHVIIRKPGILVGVIPESFLTGRNEDTLTIARVDDNILVNSTRGRKGIKLILDAIESIEKADGAVKEKFERKECEWSLKRILFRLIMYPACGLLIALGLWGLSTPQAKPIPLIAVIILGATYIVVDIRILLRKY